MEGSSRARARLVTIDLLGGRWAVRKRLNNRPADGVGTGAASAPSAQHGVSTDEGGRIMNRMIAVISLLVGVVAGPTDARADSCVNWTFSKTWPFEHCCITSPHKHQFPGIAGIGCDYNYQKCKAPSFTTPLLETQATNVSDPFYYIRCVWSPVQYKCQGTCTLLNCGQAGLQCCNGWYYADGNNPPALTSTVTTKPCPGGTPT